ncbi:MerC domain-containing protein [Thermomonas sp. HDW16]|uniref:MerC domain-containing protein n=1 Tax=Thermomonas sp. HDW16 TaxID=2714945 RepID=UPI001408A860|nr:MerC domain-containing protein [Thermomonas sp. HDW16]QIL21206.1 MerC domain-containing protein [Thermomonas sp. HDW16]
MTRTQHRLLDRLGATGSLLCALHCALLPLLIALLPTLGLGGVLDERFEQAFVLFATLVGGYSVLSGYQRHRLWQALALMLPGLLILWLGVLYRPLHESVWPHALVMTLGGTLVGLAHLANLKLNAGHVHGASCAH